MNTGVLLLSTPMRFARKGAMAITQFLIDHHGDVSCTAMTTWTVAATCSYPRLEWDSGRVRYSNL